MASTAAAASSLINFSSVNLLRFSALGLGAWYGFSRQRSLTAFVEQRHVQEEKHEHDLLVEEARVAYEAYQNRKEAAAAHPVVTDADSYKFSADKWLDWAIAYYEAKNAGTK